MDDEEHLKQMLSKHFSISCVKMINDGGIQVEDCLDTTNVGYPNTWTSTG